MRRLGVWWRPAVVLAGVCLALSCRKNEDRAAAPPAATDRTQAPSAAAPSGSRRAPATAEPTAFGERVRERRAMVDRTIAARGVDDLRVLDAMQRVPRHAFVPEVFRDRAYADRPLPIGSGQTISQPYIVAFMTEAAQIRSGDRCLEIGTGSGYQAAVLAEVCQHTYSIEYIPALAQRAEKDLRALGYGADRLSLRTGDGYVGWPEAAPFDAILVTAAPPTVPEPLIAQLKQGGRLVIPVGQRNDVQQLMRLTRTGAGASDLRKEQLMSVRFVPFLGDAAVPR